MHTSVVFALGLATSVAAQSAVSSASPPLGSVVNMFLLDTDAQPLVASYIGISNSLTTLAVNCPPGTADDQCGYPEPFTVTANPSTISAAAIYDGITLNYGCTLTGTTTGSCSVTYVGQASDLATDDAAASTATGISTITTSGALGAGDITLFPITITGGAPSDVAAAATATVTNQANSAYATSVAGDSVSASTSTSTSTSPNNVGLGGGTYSSVSSGNYSSAGVPNPVATYSAAGAYKIAAPGMLGAALLGLAALL